MQTLPLDVLKAVLAQLEPVLDAVSTTGLRELKACLLLAIGERESMSEKSAAGRSDGQDRLSDFNVEGKLQVSEATHSDFLRANQLS